jgi:hypothetical protein
MVIRILRAAIIGTLPLKACGAALQTTSYCLSEPTRKRTLQMAQGLS